MASGHLEKHSKDGYTLVIDYGRQRDPQTGKVKQVRRKYALRNVNKRQAEAELHRMITESNAGTAVEKSSMSLADYLRKWYDERCQPRLAPATLENYGIVIEKHLVPALGHVPLGELHPLRLQEMYRTMLDQGKHPRTVEQVHQVLHIALAQAVKWQMVARNIADLVEPPHPERREMKALSPAELTRLLDAARESSILELVILALHTGLRRGELLGLRWENVDLENGALRVEWALQRVNGQVLVKRPKTPKSRRVVPIDDEAVALLRGLRERNRHDYVFCRGEGEPLDPSVVTHQFADIARRAGFPMRFHDLRHTYATTALLAEVPLRVVQDLLGHEDMSTTANTYTHVLGALKKDAAAAIGRALAQTPERQISAKTGSKGSK